MPRKARELIDQGIYHVFNRGNNKMSLFNGVEDYDYFRNLLRLALVVYEAKLYHYCLMSNHFHLLIQIQHADDLGKIMHEIQLKYARYFKKRNHSVGHVFQERFRSPRIPEESYYLQCGRYIERNPVHAGLVQQAEDYPYSSAAHYVLGKKDDLITPNLYYMAMGNTPEERQIRYKDFVSLEEPYGGMIDRAILVC